MGAFLYIALMIKKLTLILKRICIYIDFERREQTLFFNYYQSVSYLSVQ